LWFDTELGQVVYGEFYNDHEKVTQTLISYELSANTTSAAANGFLPLAAETRLFSRTVAGKLSQVISSWNQPASVTES